MDTKVDKSLQHVNVWEKIAYSCGDFANNIVYAGVATYLTFFYTDIVHISAAWVGTIFLVSRILAAIANVVMGFVMEKVHFKAGKSRGWILWLAIPYGICVVLLFTVPAISPIGKVIYAFITYNLTTTVIFTAINIPYGVLNSLMTEDQVERGLLNTYRMVAAYAASIMISAITLKMVKIFGGGQSGWVWTFGCFGILSVILFLTTYRFCKERILSVDSVEISKEENSDNRSSISKTSKKSELSVWIILKSLVHNKYWVLIILFSLVLNFGYDLMGIYTYYAKYIFGDPSLAASMFTFRNIIEVTGVIVAAPFIKWIGKRNICLSAGIIIILGQLVLLFTPKGNEAMVMIGIGLAGLGMGAMFGSIFAMVADTMEYEEWRSGMRPEGVIYSAVTFGQFIGNAVSGAAIGWILGLAGYDATKLHQTTSVITGINFIFIWLPIIVGGVIILIMMFYKLDKEYDVIVHELHVRRKITE